MSDQRVAEPDTEPDAGAGAGVGAGLGGEPDAGVGGGLGVGLGVEPDAEPGGGLGVGVVAGLSSLPELAGCLREIQAVEGRLAAVKAAVIAKVGAGRLFRVDGHTSVSAWVRAEQNCSARTAAREVRRAKALAALPVTAEAAAGGGVGVDQLDVLAGLYANKRARADLVRVEAVLVNLADELPYPDFELAAARFEAHADPDGTEGSFANARAGRKARGVFVGTEFVFNAEGDNLSGVELMTILDAFTQAEFDTDWATARQTHGDNATVTDLARTGRQRRYDAWVAMARAAAGSGVVVLPEVLINLVVDAATMTDTLDRFAGVEPDRSDPATVDPAGWLRRRCETVDGVQIDPREVVAGMISGQLRRVLVDESGLVINLGRRSRLFTGAARSAVQLMYRHCTQPGCLIPASRCQIDHITPWAAGGATDVDNGDPDCGPHNRHKHRRRFTQTRDSNGQIHTFRPDGTEIAPTQRHKPPHTEPRPPPE